MKKVPLSINKGPICEEYGAGACVINEYQERIVEPSKRRQKMKTRKVAVAVSFFVLFMTALPALSLAGEGKALGGSETIKSVLQKHVGKYVELKLASGAEVKGTVGQVRHHVVLIEKLVGKDFYDAVVDIDAVNAVTYRARGN